MIRGSFRENFILANKVITDFNLHYNLYIKGLENPLRYVFKSSLIHKGQAMKIYEKLEISSPETQQKRTSDFANRMSNLCEKREIPP